MGSPPRPILIHHGIYFALGILLYRGLTSGWSWPNLAFAMVILAAAMIQIDYSEQFADKLFGLQQSAMVPITVFLLSVGATVAALYWQVKSSLLLHRIGLATYPLYLLHATYGAAVLRFVGVRFGTDRFGTFCAAIVVCVLYSFAVVFAERRLRAVLWRPNRLQTQCENGNNGE